MKKIISAFLSLVMLVSMLAGLNVSAYASTAKLNITSNVIGASDDISFKYYVTVDGSAYNGVAIGKDDYIVSDGEFEMPSTDEACIEIPMNSRYSVQRLEFSKDGYKTIDASEIISGVADEYVYTETAGSLNVDIGDNSENVGVTRNITKEEFDAATNNGKNLSVEYYFYYKDREHNDLNARVSSDKVEACYPVTLNTSNIYCLKSETKKTSYATVKVTSNCVVTEPVTSIGKTTYTIKGTINVYLNGNEYTSDYIGVPATAYDKALSTVVATATTSLRSCMTKAVGEQFNDESKSVSSSENLSEMINASMFSQKDEDKVILNRMVTLSEFSPYMGTTYTYAKTASDGNINVGFNGVIHAHKFTPTVTAPTCQQGGYTTYTCLCGESYIDDYTDTIDHNYIMHTILPATCKTEGLAKGVCSMCGDEKLEAIAYSDHIYKNRVEKATLTNDGKITPTCSICGATKQSTAIAYPKTIKLSATSYTYDGKAKKPTVTVKDSKGKAIASSNYTVTYSNNKNVGKASVKITFKGNYEGTKTLYFTINPKGTTVASVTPASKSFTVKWKKQATQTTGYQIQYATDSKFTKGAKTVTVSGAKTTSKKITKLASKKKYYVRVRTYKTVGKTKYYSAWSKAKTVTTKK